MNVLLLNFCELISIEKKDAWEISLENMSQLNIIVSLEKGSQLRQETG